MLNTWQWLVARTTQLALLFPTAFAGGVSRTLLWHKLAVGATTSLYMKSMALACVPAPITPIQTVSISIWTKGQELYLLVSTHVLYILHHTETALCSWQRKAAKGLTHFPTGGFEDEAKSQQRSEKAKRKCHCYLVGLQGSDSSQTTETLVLKRYSISLFHILTFLQCRTWFCSHLAVHEQGLRYEIKLTKHLLLDNITTQSWTLRKCSIANNKNQNSQKRTWIQRTPYMWLWSSPWIRNVPF